jgi:uncharacterized membrane protein YfcA
MVAWPELATHFGIFLVAHLLQSIAGLGSGFIFQLGYWSFVAFGVLHSSEFEVALLIYLMATVIPFWAQASAGVVVLRENRELFLWAAIPQLSTNVVGIWLLTTVKNTIIVRLCGGLLILLFFLSLLGGRAPPKSELEAVPSMSPSAGATQDVDFKLSASEAPSTASGLTTGALHEHEIGARPTAITVWSARATMAMSIRSTISRMSVASAAQPPRVTMAIGDMFDAVGGYSVNTRMTVQKWEPMLVRRFALTSRPRALSGSIRSTAKSSSAKSHTLSTHTTSTLASSTIEEDAAMSPSLHARNNSLMAAGITKISLTDGTAEKASMDAFDEPLEDKENDAIPKIILTNELRIALVVTATVAGVIEGMLGLGGIPWIVLSLVVDFEKAVMTAVLPTIFAISNVLWIVTFVLIKPKNANIAVNKWSAILVATVASLLGLYLGYRYLFDRVSQNDFRRIMRGVMIGAGVNMIVFGLKAQIYVSIVFMVCFLCAVAYVIGRDFYSYCVEGGDEDLDEMDTDEIR